MKKIEAIIKPDYAFLRQTPQTPGNERAYCSWTTDGNGFGGNFCADVTRRNYDLPEGFVLTAIDELIMKWMEIRSMTILERWLG